MSHTEIYPVPLNLVGKTHIDGFADYKSRYERSLKSPDEFWADVAQETLTWIKPWERVRSGDFNSVDYRWFEGGKLNVSSNCLDRHLEKHNTDIAFIWAKDELGQYESITYQKAFEEVCRISNLLSSLGVKKGDRVCLYLPMIPELAYSMLACARIGAVHSIVFGGFSADSLRDRINDAQCKVVITANEGLRGGKTIPLKVITDQALHGVSSITHVLVAKRTDTEVAMLAGRDLWLSEEASKQKPYCDAVPMDSEDPLFVLYTSGSTGKPKGLLHTTGGYLTYAAHTFKNVFDYRPGEIYFCGADIGWVTGHSYVVYGPLANGATSVLFESTPLYPDASRYWKIIDDLSVNIFYTAPTALRALAQKGNDWVTQTSRKSLRILGSVGEPINPEIWRWYHNVVGNGACSIVDTWWQTETGGILISPLPGVTPMKPGSATLPLFGIVPVLVDPESGRRLEGNNVSGALCLETSWPGQARTILGDHERFRSTYFSQYPGLYFTGDGCTRDQDGYYWITGRIDDVLNVSGHRIGTAEIESALVEHHAVAESAVVGFPHDIKGTGIYAYVVLYENQNNDEHGAAWEKTLKEQVAKSIGKFASPDAIHITKGLPKTRSGKVMRRILRKIASSEYDSLGDVSTLAEPEVVRILVDQHKRSQKSDRSYHS